MEHRAFIATVAGSTGSAGPIRSVPDKPQLGRIPGEDTDLQGASGHRRRAGRPQQGLLHCARRCGRPADQRRAVSPSTTATSATSDGRLRRQAARFEIFRHRFVRSEDPGEVVRRVGNGVRAMEWSVHLANKKAAWYQFIVNAGADGYAPDHPLRNADVTDAVARQRSSSLTPVRAPCVGRERLGASRAMTLPSDYPVTFPPTDTEPERIDTLGSIAMDDESAAARDSEGLVTQAVIATPPAPMTTPTTTGGGTTRPMDPSRRSS